jgi:hypothetical protein
MLTEYLHLSFPGIIHYLDPTICCVGIFSTKAGKANKRNIFSLESNFGSFWFILNMHIFCQLGSSGGLGARSDKLWREMRNLLWQKHRPHECLTQGICRGWLLATFSDIRSHEKHLSEVCVPVKSADSCNRNHTQHG